MQDGEISINDMFKRKIPDITLEEKIDYIVNTHAFDSIPVTKEEVIQTEQVPDGADPFIAGQIRCINYMKILADQTNLFPLKERVTAQNFDKCFNWFKALYKNRYYDLYLSNLRDGNNYDFPQGNDLDTYRTGDYVMSDRKACAPSSIKQLLAEAFNEFIAEYKKCYDRLDNPKLMERHEYKALEIAAYELGLSIWCIHPFDVGNGGIGRIVENICRLHVGLRLQTYANKQTFNNDAALLYYRKYKNR